MPTTAWSAPMRACATEPQAAATASQASRAMPVNAVRYAVSPIAFYCDHAAEPHALHCPFRLASTAASCPNDCSFHGACTTMSRIALLEGIDTDPGTAGDGDGPSYTAWDADVTYGCRCDYGFFAPDCSLRALIVIVRMAHLAHVELPHP